ncbi:MAG TPA: sulfur oxidation c-type cytochrome SoxX [Candidatus Sulfotelmatobacter sp.]|nr:sulfur oxidation c-type cytochrome SoxX [Candidatus Sulfotelmatobacter sp.]
MRCSDSVGQRLPGRARLRAAGWAAAAAVGWSALAAGAEALRPFTVVGDTIPRSLTGRPGDPRRGREVLLSRQLGNCLLCHRVPIPEERFQGNLGPDLAGVGSRLSAGQIRLRIVDEGRLNPDTIMPPYYRVEGLRRVMGAYREEPVLTAEQVEDVVAFVRTFRR